jgi:8-oxo-dGTP pyrophosphatase MutT (NUDIX family)
MPGGGIDSGETEEECVRREMQEETNLDVRVISLLVNELARSGNLYQQSLLSKIKGIMVFGRVMRT